MNLVRFHYRYVKFFGFLAWCDAWRKGYIKKFKWIRAL